MVDSASWRDPHVGAEAWQTLQRHLAEGRTRILVWGPPGVGKTTLLARLPQGIASVDARSVAEACEALARAGGAIVVSATTRVAIDADAYVECTPLALDEREEGALAFLLRLRARDGFDAPHGEELALLRRIAIHTEGLPGALCRASELLRLMSAEELCARCDAALRELTIFGRASEHPLRLATSDAPLDPWDERLTNAATVLVALGEAAELAEAEARIATITREPALDVLLALRDAGALRVDGSRVEISPSIARALARDVGFRERFAASAEQIDEDAIASARAARKRWLETGAFASIQQLERDAKRLRRAIERALVVVDRRAPERVVDCVLALRTFAEIQIGPRAEGPLVRRALDALPNEPALVIEHARVLRLAGDFVGAARALDTLDQPKLSDALAARWHGERAQILRQQRALDQAFDHAERARALYASVGWAHEEARHVIELGSIRYWQERYDDARALFERGRSLAAALGAERTEAIALSNLCLCHTLAGDDAAATASGLRAVSLFERVGDRGARGTTLGHLGILGIQYARFADADRFLAEAETSVEAAGYLEQLRFVRFNRAQVALATGRIDDAEERRRALETMLAASPDAMVSMSLDELESDLCEHAGRHAEALVALDRGLARATSGASVLRVVQLGSRRVRVLARLGEKERSREAANEVRRALRDLTREEQRIAAEIAIAHAAHLRGEGEPAERGVLVDALRPCWEGLAARTRVGVSVADSWAVRQAASAYFRDLAPEQRVQVEWASRDPSASALCLDEARERARVPGGGEIDGATRRNAYRLVMLLATVHPNGRARDELIAEMWPGERMLESAALNRLHNAVAQLRAAGLGQRLARDAGGYRLDATLRLVRAGRVDPFASA